MAESSLQKTSSPKITPKEEPVTLDKSESPNPFLPARQVDFTFDEITFTTHNEVALLYPLHPNQYYFEAVSNFISKCCLKEAFTRAPNQYKECLSEVWYTTKTLDDFKVDYAKITWEDLIHKMNKKTREKIVPYPRSLVFTTSQPNQPEEPPFTDHMKAICNLDVPVDSKAPKPSSQTEEVPQCKSLKLKVDLEENNLQNTHLCPRPRHPNPKLANQKKIPSPVRPRTKAQAILHLPHQWLVRCIKRHIKQLVAQHL
ncbi:hypothetical protein Tco_1451405 [Tanacetum coccineum]